MARIGESSSNTLRHLGEFFIALLAVALIAGIGSVLGLMLFMARLPMLLSVFAGPTYLFFILVGSVVGYLINRRRCSMAAAWVWILPAIWSSYAAATDLSSGIHEGETITAYIWNTLILGNHELALISQCVIAVPLVTSLAYSVGAALAMRRRTLIAD